MAYGSAFGIRKILICGAGICYLVILRGEGGIAKKVTALWFILFGPGRFPVLQRERTRDCLMLYGTRSCFHRVYPERNLVQRCFKRCLQRLKQTLDIVRNKKKKRNRQGNVQGTSYSCSFLAIGILLRHASSTCRHQCIRLIA